MKVIKQRSRYLENLKLETRKFWREVVAEYNAGMTAKVIAEKHTNPRTGRAYSRQYIHAILSKMALEN